MFAIAKFPVTFTQIENVVVNVVQYGGLRVRCFGLRPSGDHGSS